MAWRKTEMRFYDCRTAPSPRRVRIFLAEKDIEVETVEVDLGTGEQYGEAFRRINPDCVVPALELDDGNCLSEVMAICQYIEDLHPEPNLLGRTPLERAPGNDVERQGRAAGSAGNGRSVSQCGQRPERQSADRPG